MYGSDGDARPAGPGITTWLDSLEPGEVADIFISRCILNGYRPKDFSGGPVDVDAIHLAGPGRQPELVEFKRKDSATGMYLPYDGASYEVLLETALRYNRKPEAEVSDAFSSRLFARSGGCFGLDADSHALNVGFCFRHHIRYRYLIWDQSPETDLSARLGPDYMPLRPLRLKQGLICPADFHGIAYSPPEKSTSVGAGRA